MDSEEKVSYSGESSHKFVDRLMNSSKGKLLIISPFIDKYYANILLNLAKRRGRHIYLIISGSALNYDAIRILRRGAIKGFIKSIIFIALLDSVIIFFKFYELFFIVNIPFFVVWLAMLFRRKGILSKISLKIIRKRFVHEKIYISDIEAIVGSANLTYNGMHKNIEHIEIIKEKSRIDELKRHFNGLWNKY